MGKTPTGLSASALIEYYERQVKRGDSAPRLVTAIERAADFIWDKMWVDDAIGTAYGQGAFEYVQLFISGVGRESPTPDL